MIECRRLGARPATLLIAALMSGPAPAIAQESGTAAASDSPPSIEETVAAMEKLDGLFPLYWDAAAGAL